MTYHRPYALVGIDNTLSDQIGVDTFEDRDFSKDIPIPGMHAFVTALHMDNWRVIGITSRNERWRKPTMDWLLRHEFLLDEVLMRADSDYRSADEVKMSLAIDRFPNELHKAVKLVVDDRDDVLAAFNAIGITTLLVHGGRQ
jgi:hypothetical protein